jgi:hypothetical protein
MFEIEIILKEFRLILTVESQRSKAIPFPSRTASQKSREDYGAIRQMDEKRLQ